MVYEDLKIENLAQYNSVVFLLGAGASKDYGFPLWNDLKIFFDENLEKIINKQSDIFHPNNFSDEDLEKLLKWKEVLDATDWSMSTIDNVIYLNGEIKDPILKLLSLKISQCERDDIASGSNKNKWISVFAEKIADFLITKRTGDNITDSKFAATFLQKIKIITLNYDRCFEYHFSTSFKEFLERGLNRNNNDWTKYYSKLSWGVVHPHGAIANYFELDRKDFKMNCHYITYKNSTYGNIIRSYGQNNDVSIDIAEVDDLKDGIDENAAYKLTNSIISTGDVVVSLGLSSAGIINSHISFPDTPIYYFSNNDMDRSKIEEKIKSKNQTYLNMYCSNFIKLL